MRSGADCLLANTLLLPLIVQISFTELKVGDLA
jgi:hypothetical protein